MEFPDFLRGVLRFVPPYSPVTPFLFFYPWSNLAYWHARLFIPSPTGLSIVQPCLEKPCCEFLLYCLTALHFFFSRSFLTARRSKGTGLFYWAASRHRLFLYWPVSRCACGGEGISPDLPLPGWEATVRHSWAGVGEEVAEGW